MCFTCWLRSGFPQFMNIDSLSFTWSLLAVDTRLVLTTFKITNLFNLKDAVPEGLRTRVVYKFSCARRIVMLVMLVKPADVSPQEFAGTSDRSSNAFRHLQSSESCRTSCTPDCFQILDSAATKYQVRLK